MLCNGRRVLSNKGDFCLIGQSNLEFHWLISTEILSIHSTHEKTTASFVTHIDGCFSSFNQTKVSFVQRNTMLELFPLKTQVKTRNMTLTRKKENQQKTKKKIPLNLSNAINFLSRSVRTRSCRFISMSHRALAW